MYGIKVEIEETQEYNYTLYMLLYILIDTNIYRALNCMTSWPPKSHHCMRELTTTLVLVLQQYYEIIIFLFPYIFIASLHLKNF